MAEALPSFCTQFYTVAKDFPQSVNTTYINTKKGMNNNDKENITTVMYMNKGNFVLW